MNLKIGVIGCGNMATSIVLGIFAKSQSIAFKTYTPSSVRAQHLAKQVNGEWVDSLDKLKDCDLCLIGCKPQQFSSLSARLREAGLEDQHYISMMAAVSLERLKEELPRASFSRVMPNTPIQTGRGITLLLHEEKLTTELKRVSLELFQLCSTVQEVISEEMFDRMTTITGSGPAYLFYFARCFSDELVKQGLGQKEAKKVVTELFIGSSLLMEKSGDQAFDDLVDQVTSKGGVTIEAINIFKEKGLDRIVHDALASAFKRSIAMTKEF